MDLIIHETIHAFKYNHIRNQNFVTDRASGTMEPVDPAP